MASIGKAAVASSLFPDKNCFIQVPCGALHLESFELIFEVLRVIEREK